VIRAAVGRFSVREALRSYAVLGAVLLPMMLASILTRKQPSSPV